MNYSYIDCHRSPWNQGTSGGRSPFERWTGHIGRGVTHTVWQRDIIQLDRTRQNWVKSPAIERGLRGLSTMLRDSLIRRWVPPCRMPSSVKPKSSRWGPRWYLVRCAWISSQQRRVMSGPARPFSGIFARARCLIAMHILYVTLQANN